MEFEPSGILKSLNSTPGIILSSQILSSFISLFYIPSSLLLKFFIYLGCRWGRVLAVPHYMKDVMPRRVWLDGEVH